MIQGIYTVRDEASQAYMALQLNDGDASAIRSFDYAMTENPIMRFKPSDFSLWYLGTYDDQTGIIGSVPPKKIKQGVKQDGRKRS